MQGVYIMTDVKIKVKKTEIEYCFKAENYDEFQRRFNQLVDIMYQRFINELTMKQVKESMFSSFYGHAIIDSVRSEKWKK